ncbi:MAG: hypothetical protein IT229_01970 [Flavobacteriales bacterium]|nr:hypothetical protein [Flavobacteriales bacterium]
MLTQRAIPFIIGLAAIGVLSSLVAPVRTQLPRFWFEENSTTILRDSAFYLRQGEGAAPTILLNWVVDVLQDNPTTVLGVHGYADPQEARPDSISLARALTIRDTLVLRGFPVSRFRLEALGASGSLIDSLNIDRMATEEERRTARQENRRVHLSIVEWNWKP